jgi:trimethylamine--corrinoid protein Co-methyltransferase
MSRYETAFYSPLLSNWDNYDNWVERGRQDTMRRANQIWKKLLSEYEQPAIDAGIEEALRDYVARRKREGGARGD